MVTSIVLLVFFFWAMYGNLWTAGLAPFDFLQHLLVFPVAFCLGGHMPWFLFLWEWFLLAATRLLHAIFLLVLPCIAYFSVLRAVQLSFQHIDPIMCDEGGIRHFYTNQQQTLATRARNQLRQHGCPQSSPTRRQPSPPPAFFSKSSYRQHAMLFCKDINAVQNVAEREREGGETESRAERAKVAREPRRESYESREL